jgi:hypothetical protein
MRDRVEYRLRFLGGCGIVEIHQRLTVHGLIQDREIRANLIA